MNKQFKQRNMKGITIAVLLTVLPFAQVLADNNAGGIAIEEIIVTATKREVDIQSVPMSISALQEETLIKMGARDFQDYVLSIPGLSYRSEGPGRNKISLRGVTDGASVLTQPTTGIYIDETPVSFTGFDPDLRLIDISRVEVLRGPQGTLYGAGSMGGTIRVISNKPDTEELEWSAHAGTSFTRNGDLNYEIDGVLNIPIVEDKFAVRMVGYYSDEDGFIDDIQLNEEDVNDEETKGVRGSFMFTPTSDFKFTGTVMYQDTDQGGSPRDDVGTAPLTEATFVREIHEDEFKLFNGLIEWDLGSVSLVSSTTYFEQDVVSIGDITNLVTSLGLIAAPPAPSILETRLGVENLVHESRLSSNGDGRLQWLIGVFHSDRDIMTSDDNIVPGFDLVSVLAPLVVGDNLLHQDNNIDNKQTAVFGEVSYKLTSSLEATIGLRWFKTDLESNQNNVSPILGSSTSQQSGSDDAVNPKFLLKYTPSETAMIFAQAARGFRQGIANSNIDALCAADLQALGFDTTPFADSDSLWNYELGTKTSWFDNRLIVNGSVYFVKWDDIQVRRQLLCGLTLFVNGAEAESKGFELEIMAAPTEGLQLAAGFSYTDAEVTEGGPDLGAVDGESLPNVPQWTASLAFLYNFPVLETFSGYVRGEFNFVDERTNEFSSLPTVAQVPLDSYTTGKLRLGVSPGSERWDLSVYVDNLWDTQADLFARVNPISQSQFRNRPRTIGIEFRINGGR